MSSKYKSPLIRSRSISTAEKSQIVESTPKPTNLNLSDNKLNTILVHDNTPQTLPVSQHWRGRGSSSPRFNSPRPRGSPYQWTSPNRFNSSWGSYQQNKPSYTSCEQNNYSSPNRFNSSWSSYQQNKPSYTSYEQNNYSSHRPQFNNYKNQNFNNSPNWHNESYFHPSMLEDPWAPLLNNSTFFQGN